MFCFHGIRHVTGTSTAVSLKVSPKKPCKLLVCLSCCVMKLNCFPCLLYFRQWYRSRERGICDSPCPGQPCSQRGVSDCRRPTYRCESSFSSSSFSSSACHTITTHKDRVVICPYGLTDFVPILFWLLALLPLQLVKIRKQSRQTSRTDFLLVRKLRMEKRTPTISLKIVKTLQIDCVFLTVLLCLDETYKSLNCAK